MKSVFLNEGIQNLVHLECSSFKVLEKADFSEMLENDQTLTLREKQTVPYLLGGIFLIFETETADAESAYVLNTAKNYFAPLLIPFESIDKASVSELKNKAFNMIRKILQKSRGKRFSYTKNDLLVLFRQSFQSVSFLQNIDLSLDDADVTEPRIENFCRILFHLETLKNKLFDQSALIHLKELVSPLSNKIDTKSALQVAYVTCVSMISMQLRIEKSMSKAQKLLSGLSRLIFDQQIKAECEKCMSEKNISAIDQLTENSLKHAFSVILSQLSSNQAFEEISPSFVIKFLSDNYARLHFLKNIHGRIIVNEIKSSVDLFSGFTQCNQIDGATIFVGHILEKQKLQIDTVFRTSEEFVLQGAICIDQSRTHNYISYALTSDSYHWYNLSQDASEMELVFYSKRKSLSLPNILPIRQTILKPSTINKMTEKRKSTNRNMGSQTKIRKISGTDLHLSKKANYDSEKEKSHSKDPVQPALADTSNVPTKNIVADRSVKKHFHKRNSTVQSILPNPQKLLQAKSTDDKSNEDTINGPLPLDPPFLPRYSVLTQIEDAANESKNEDAEDDWSSIFEFE